VPVHIRRGTVVLSGGGDYTSLLLNQDTLKLGANNGISTQAVLFVTSIASRNGTFDLNGSNQEVAGLQGPGSNSTATTTNSAAAPSTLTLNTTADSTYGGTIVGNVTLVKTGAATQTLGNTNTYSGITTIGNGTLALGATGLIVNSPAINLASNATFDVSAVSGGYLLEAGQTLTGYGTVNGSVTANGTVSPGASIGQLTFNNDLTLVGTNIMEVTKDGGLTNDVIVITGTPNFGGTLKVVLVGSTMLAVNDTFKLFQFTTAPGANFPTFDLPGGGYTWDTSQLTVDGTIKVTGIPTPSSSPPPATLTSVSRSGSNMTMIWSGGTNESVVLLSSTNVTQSRATWTPVQTNTVLSDGLSTNVVPIDSAERKRFYQLVIPYP
jgi:autotransporter-associated beta strand protein